MNFSKLASVATVISVISGITFTTITAFNSEDGNIKAAITKLRNAALNYKGKYEEAQKNYEDTLRDLGNTQQSLEAAKQKLMDIYKALTGQDYTGNDILAFDFDTIIPENNFDNNVDGDEIAAQLGLQAGATTQEILAAIIDLQNQVASLSEQVTNLQGQVQAYANEAAELKALLEAEQTRLEQERTALDNLMKQINKEEQEQLALANEALEAVGEEAVSEDPEQSEPEVTEPTLEEAEANLRTALSNVNTTQSIIDSVLDGSYTLNTTKTSGWISYVTDNGGGSTLALTSSEEGQALWNAYQTWLALK